MSGIARQGLVPCEIRYRASVPLVGFTVAAGFPSPAEDYLDRPLDFNELLIQHPAATFAVRVAGDSMVGAGIHAGDIAVVDRSLTASNGNVVLAIVDGEFTLKRYRVTGGRVWLEAANQAYPPLLIEGSMVLEIFGVVRHSIRML